MGIKHSCSHQLLPSKTKQPNTDINIHKSVCYFYPLYKATFDSIIIFQKVSKGYLVHPPRMRLLRHQLVCEQHHEMKNILVKF